MDTMLDARSSSLTVEVNIIEILHIFSLYVDFLKITEICDFSDFHPNFLIRSYSLNIFSLLLGVWN